MRTLATLSQLQKISLSLPSLPVPSEATSTAIGTQLKTLQELPSVSILNFVAEENETKLCKIVSRLKSGTPFYSLSVLAYNLSKSETDFDLLTSSENVPVYEQMLSISELCGIDLPPYINVLKKIAANKQFGLYSENQEIGFFLEEYDRYKNACDATEFLRGFRKILKYPTQCLFERFIHDGIFSLIKSTLKKHALKIASEQTLVFYVYGLHYYQSGISNKDENFLLEHIKFCVSHLLQHDEIAFQMPAKTPLFPAFENDESAIDYFFAHNKAAVHSLDRFIGLLKDMYQSSEANEFCNFLRLNLYKNNRVRFGDTKNHFAKIMARTIRQKAKSENVRLYTDICSLMPQVYVCSRSPNIWHHNGEVLYIFNDETSKATFYAFEKGNKNANVPEAHIKIEVEIVEKNKDGYVTLWKWNHLTP